MANFLNIMGRLIDGSTKANFVKEKWFLKLMFQTWHECNLSLLILVYFISLVFKQ